jgi:hypothetical protein
MAWYHAPPPETWEVGDMGAGDGIGWYSCGYISEYVEPHDAIAVTMPERNLRRLGWTLLLWPRF